jgi:hypothetical protein
MQTFVVERYVPRIRSEELRSDCERVCQALREATGAEEGLSEVLYLHSVYVPDDEVSFCLYRSHSAESIADGFDRANVAFDRILQAEVLEP